MNMWHVITHIAVSQQEYVTILFQWHSHRGARKYFLALQASKYNVKGVEIRQNPKIKQEKVANFCIFAHSSLLFCPMFLLWSPPPEKNAGAATVFFAFFQYSLLQTEKIVHALLSIYLVTFFHFMV